MPVNRLRTATARLASRLTARAGDAAVYTRDAGLGSAEEHDLVVVQGRERDIARDGARAETFRRLGWDRDLLFSVESFAETGLVEPSAGDRIAFAENGGTTTLEIFTPEGERAWRYADQTRALYRVHCRQVSP